MRSTACGRLRRAIAYGALLVLGTGLTHPAAAQDNWSKAAGGISVYLGIVPAEIVKGPPTHSPVPPRPMHGRAPRGPHEVHVVAAVFDATSNARVADAVVTAQVSGLGLSGPKKTLEAMEINGTITYGAFFSLPGHDLYKVSLTIQRPGVPTPVRLDFNYDHRRS